MYRQSDADCAEHDAPELEQYRETMDVLSQEATDLIGELLEPRLAFSGHSHNFCVLQNRLNVEEFTIPSFSWRNRDNPAFALVRDSDLLLLFFLLRERFSHSLFQATFTEKDYSVAMCTHMPKESAMIRLYVICAIMSLLNILRLTWRGTAKKHIAEKLGQD